MTPDPERYLRPLPALMGAVMLAAAMAPGTALAQSGEKHLALVGIQSGTVTPSGSGFVALSLTDRRSPSNSENDGSAVFGFGFGDANDVVGVQLAAHITSLHDDFGDSGYFSVRFAKRLSEGPTPVYGSLQFGQLANWGDADGRDETAAVAFTRFSSVTMGRSGEQYPLMMTLGAGTHVRDFETKAGVFGGIGMGLSENMATSLAWTGDGLTLGTSFRFKDAPNTVFNLSIDDATNRVDNRRVIFSVGHRFTNLFGG